MTRTALVIALLAWTLALTGCVSALAPTAGWQTQSDPAGLTSGRGGGSESAATLPDTIEIERSTPPKLLPTAVDAQKIVYNGRFTVVVHDVPKAVLEFRQYAEQAGGFMARSTLDEITVRVPSAKFDQTAEKLRDMGIVAAQDISAVDVTEQYSDLELRLAAARTAMKRYAELLEKSQKVEDALAVERELQRVRLDVEQLEGQLRHLFSQVSYATVVVRFAPTRESSATQRLPFRWLGRLGLEPLLAWGV